MTSFVGNFVVHQFTETKTLFDELRTRQQKELQREKEKESILEKVSKVLSETERNGKRKIEELNKTKTTLEKSLKLFQYDDESQMLIEGLKERIKDPSYDKKKLEEIYQEIIKRFVRERFKEDLKSLLTVPQSDCTQPDHDHWNTKEKYRVYDLLLSACKIKEEKNPAPPPPQKLTQEPPDDSVIWERYTAAASGLTWEMLKLLPPLVVCKPLSYDGNLQDTHRLTWDEEKECEGKLRYYRPVLVYSNHLHVAVKGQVGNKHLTTLTDKLSDKLANNGQVTPATKEPLSRADTIKRSVSGYRITTGNIAAIDFGTTSVTLAYTTRGDKENNTLILDTANKDTRVPNAILLFKNDSSFSVVSFGSEAQNNFSKMRPDHRSKYIYFERIKMLMRKDKSISRQSKVESFTGDKFFLVEVIAYILKYLKDTLIGHLAPTARPLKAEDFDWVITVPAIWDARGKRMMREAAYMAGLTSGEEGLSHLTPFRPGVTLPCPDDINPDKLSLALEPEGAAIYSQLVTAKQVIEAGTSRFLKPEGAYLVLDIGGGTVDITAQAEVAGGIEVLSIPMGNDWGGTKVNEQFSKMFQEIVGDHEFSRYLSSGDSTVSTTRRAVLNKLLYIEFESQKVIFGDGKSNEICINIPTDIVKFYGESKIKTGASKFPGVEFTNDALYINTEVVEEKLFGPPVKGIIEAMVTIMKGLDERIDTFYLVGGFGGCKYLYTKLGEAIKKHLGKTQCRIIVPETPKLAVANGAVMWRKDPDNIKARRADATYGIDIQSPFNEEKHDAHYRVYNEDQKFPKCDDVFKVFLQKGEVAKSDEVFTSSLVPSFQKMTRMCIDIWSTPKHGVQYIKDKDGKPTVEKIGQLVIDIPNPNNLPRAERVVTVQMDFSGTEIQAKAKYQVTGEEVNTVCDFLTVQAK